MKRMTKIMTIIAVLAVLISVLPSALAVTELPFDDKDDIHYTPAVLMLTDLGIAEGYPDDSFRPAEKVTRAQAAKLIVSVIGRGESEQVQVLDTPPFNDIEGSWAEEYILFCYSRGIVSGYADGRFDPGGYVTAEQFAKMLMIALGYDRALFVGEEWRQGVSDMAEELDLYRDYAGYEDYELTREAASLLLFNALQCDVVESYGDDGLPQYYLDELMNPISMLELYWDVTRYSSIVTGNEYADLTGESLRLEKGRTKLQYYKEIEVSTDLSYLGRQVNIFLGPDGRLYGKPSFSETDIVLTAEGRTVLDQIMEFNDLYISGDTQCYVNYSVVETSDFESITENDRVTLIDCGGNGIIDLVLIVRYRDVTVAEIGEDAYILEEGDSFGGSLEFELIAEDTYEPEAGETVSVAQIGGLFYIERIHP